MNNPPVPYPHEIRVHPGTALLAGIERGPSLTAHREQYGDLPRLDVDTLLELVTGVGLKGRGGAGFPFGTKLETVRSRAGRNRRPVVVVNLSEGESASSKDAALAQTRPHLVLDGAVATARALRATEIHVVLPAERAMAALRMRGAVAERSGGPPIRLHTAEPRFVAGQSTAVVELHLRAPQPAGDLMASGCRQWVRRPSYVALERRDLGPCGPARPARRRPLPAARHLRGAGHRATHRHRHPSGAAGARGRVRRPAPGRAPERGRRRPRPGRRIPRLVGGLADGGQRAGVGERHAAARRTARGRGRARARAVVCPLALTTRIVDYLAGQSAGRCGPCLNGLPALAAALHRVVNGQGGRARLEELAALVVRRGACAHPDGTVRLVRSVFAALPGEVDAHRVGGCLGVAEELAS